MTASNALVPSTVAPTYDIPVGLLDEPDRNPNYMPQDQYDLLVVSIREVGFKQPILVRPNPKVHGRFLIVDGVHRTRAAKASGMPAVPVLFDGKLANDEATALQLSMNRLRGELNMTEVARSLADLHAAGWDIDALTVTGFSTDEVTELLKTTREVTADDVLREPVGGSADETANAEEDVREHILEIPFKSKDAMQKARAALRKAAGGGRKPDLAQGLMTLIDEVSS